jgi:hypothetical protein
VSFNDLYLTCIFGLGFLEFQKNFVLSFEYWLASKIFPQLLSEEDIILDIKILLGCERIFLFHRIFGLIKGISRVLPLSVDNNLRFRTVDLQMDRRRWLVVSEFVGLNHLLNVLDFDHLLVQLFIVVKTYLF